MHSSTSSSSVLIEPVAKRGIEKQIAYALLCLLLFFVADRLLASALWSRIIKSGFRYSVLYHGPVNADIVVLGNSRGMALVNWPYVESKTHKKLFSLCYNGISSPLLELLFKDYLDRNRAPKVLLIEVTGVMGSETLIQELKLYGRASSRIEALLRDNYPWLYWGSKISNLYAFNGEMLLRNLYYLKKSDHDWLIEGHVTPGVLAELAKARMQPWDALDQAKLDALADTIHLAQQRGIKVKLVIGPYLPGFLRSVSNNDRIFDEIRSRAGLPITDYSGALSDPAEFADRIHINRDGAQIISERMIEEGIFD